MATLKEQLLKAGYQPSATVNRATPRYICNDCGKPVSECACHDFIFSQVKELHNNER